MFSLIVSIISIALVAVLAAASIYYGGDAFTKGSAKALASTVVTQAQQISSANTLFKNDNGGLPADDVAELVSEDYLASTPVVPAKAQGTLAEGVEAGWAVDANTVTVALNNEEVCKLINEQATGTKDVVAYTPGAADAAQFGCNHATATFTYKG